MPGNKQEYVAWAEFRYQIRVWLRLSEEAAREEGITPQQHQLLLATRGYPGARPPLIADLAERLQLRHHSVVGLIDRMEADGLVTRREIGVGRGTTVLLTPTGRAVLERISARLRPELRAAADALITSLTPLLPSTTRRPSHRQSSPQSARG